MIFFSFYFFFTGYETINLDNYVGINAGDKFCIEMHTPYMPILSNTRQHFEPESSRQVTSAGVIDMAANGMAAALKAYTLPKNFTTQNVFVYCSPQITVQSNLTGAQIIIEQNGKPSLPELWRAAK